jgi:hypothetical protein
VISGQVQKQISVNETKCILVSRAIAWPISAPSQKAVKIAPGNCDQWSSWSTFPEIIIIMLEKESMHSAMTELAAIRRRLNR